MSNLLETFNLKQNALGYLTSSVQFGFIIGTLVFALFTIADRFSPSKVFFFSAILGAFFNLGFIFENQTLFSLISLRFFTGFFLANTANDINFSGGDALKCIDGAAFGI